MLNKPRSILALAAVASLASASSAMAITITSEQAGGTAGSIAGGAVGGPVGGFVGGFAGRLIGRALHRKSHDVAFQPPAAATGVTLLPAGRLVDPVVNDRAVDTTPMRTIEVGPAQAQDAFRAARPASASTASFGAGGGAASAGARPGTLDYQLQQLRAGRSVND
jgi:hypothetical protein